MKPTYIYTYAIPSLFHSGVPIYAFIGDHAITIPANHYALQHDDGREEALLDFVQNHPSIATMRNNPAAVVAAIDEYAASKKFLMTLGQHKLEIIRKILEEMSPKPKVVVELGTYIGYSAIAFGGMMRDMYGPDAVAQGVMVYSMELDPRWAAITNKILQLAGLEDVVQVVVGAAADSIRQLHANCKLPKIDVLVLDHWEKFYVSDLKVCEELKLLEKGAVVLADNVLVPGAPEYLKYVRSSGRYESKGVDSMVPNGWTVSELLFRKTAK